MQVPKAQTSMEKVEAQLTVPAVRRVCAGASELLLSGGSEKCRSQWLGSQHPDSRPRSLQSPQDTPFLGHCLSTLLRAESAQTRH